MGRRNRSGPAGAIATQPESEDRIAGRAIEQFHFVFCEVAATELPIQDFALKGGGNLRMFLRSRRRSRDLDFDFLGKDFDRFADRVDRVIASRALGELLRVRGIRLIEPHRTKDTASVKRWELALAASGMEDAPSKIEFSGRGTEHEPALERVDADLARRLRARPVMINHYPPGPAIEQKVTTLAVRSETQPRDVFDLDHLFREYPNDLTQATMGSAVVQRAVARARESKYDDYLRLVVGYLEEEFVPMYGSEEAWNEMLLRVTQQLQSRGGAGR